MYIFVHILLHFWITKTFIINLKYNLIYFVTKHSIVLYFCYSDCSWVLLPWTWEKYRFSLEWNRITNLFVIPSSLSAQFLRVNYAINTFICLYIYLSERVVISRCNEFVYPFICLLICTNWSNSIYSCLILYNSSSLPIQFLSLMKYFLHSHHLTKLTMETN